MNRIELLTNDIPHCNLWANRAEKERYVRLVKTWQKKNKDASLEATALFEHWTWLHILIQRLRDNRVNFAGEPLASKGWDMSAEDIDTKRKELKEWMPLLLRNQLEVMKLAMANNVSLNISGDAGSVQSLFAARDKLKGKDASSN
jgi:hypothetical protein